MILLSVLSILKTLLFINMTSVEWNRVLIFFISALISIFILSLIDLWDSKYKKVLLFGFYTVFSILMLGDAIYYSYFSGLPSVKMLGQVGQLKAVSDSVKSLFTLKNLLFIVDLPLVAIYLFKSKKRVINRANDNKKFIIPGISLLILIGLFIKINVSGEINSIKLQEIYSFHFTDIKNSLVEKNNPDEYAYSVSGNRTFEEEDLKEYQERARLKEGNYTGIGKDKNLIVIQVEALQGFVVDLIYKGQEVSPNLNKLIHDKSSLYYDEYYQLLGRGNTADAEFVTNNSLHPSMESPTYSQYETNSFYGLPWLLRDNGYKAWAFHGYEKEFWNREAAYGNQGFERFISQEDFEFQEVIGLGITDKDFFHQSIEYLKTLGDDPYYGFLVTLTSHNPYDMPEKYHVLDLEDKHKDTLLGNYLQSIRYFDEALGDFLEELKQEGIYENSVIAMYGDHFAIQNTNEEISILMADFLGRQYHYDDIMNIPLVIHVPGEELGETISKVSSQLDFYPTISNIMGYDNTKGLVFGRDINNYEGYTNVKPQTIMRKGSFLDEDVMFEISRTEIFAHSRAYDRNTRGQLEIDDYRDIYDSTIEEINKSEFILRNNLMKYLLEGDGNLELESLGSEGLVNTDPILKVDIDKTKDIEKTLSKEYKKGNKILALEVNLDMDFEPLIKWSKNHPKGHILFRNQDEDKVEIFERIKFLHNDFKKNSLVEINSFDEHYYITSYGYENLLLNITDQEYTDREVLDFLNVHEIFGVVLDEKRLATDLSKEINELGIDVYIEEKDEIIIHR